MEIEEDNDAWCFLAHPFSLSPTTVAAATGVRCAFADCGLPWLWAKLFDATIFVALKIIILLK
jgi:hypothetical protein